MPPRYRYATGRSMDFPVPRDFDIALFFERLYLLLNDPTKRDIIRWSDDEKKIVIWNDMRMPMEICPLLFELCTWANFLQTLYACRFRRVRRDGLEFTHELFSQRRLQTLTREERHELFRTELGYKPTRLTNRSSLPSDSWEDWLGTEICKRTVPNAAGNVQVTIVTPTGESSTASTSASAFDVPRPRVRKNSVPRRHEGEDEIVDVENVSSEESSGDLPRSTPTTHRGSPSDSSTLISEHHPTSDEESTRNDGREDNGGEETTHQASTNNDQGDDSTSNNGVSENNSDQESSNHDGEVQGNDDSDEESANQESSDHEGEDQGNNNSDEDSTNQESSNNDGEDQGQSNDNSDEDEESTHQESSNNDGEGQDERSDNENNNEDQSHESASGSEESGEEAASENDETGDEATSENDEPGDEATSENDEPGDEAASENDEPGDEASSENDEPGDEATGGNEEPLDTIEKSPPVKTRRLRKPETPSKYDRRNHPSVAGPSTSAATNDPSSASNVDSEKTEDQSDKTTETQRERIILRISKKRLSKKYKRKRDSDD